MNTLLYGAHMSIAGALEKAILDGQSIGCTAIQIFTKSNRQWNTKPLNQEEVELFKKTKAESSIRIVVAHAGYLINIGSSNSAVEHQSIASLIDELQRCSLLEIPYLVLHPGSCGQSAMSDCIKKVIKNINYVLHKTSSNTMILLENMASQGSTIGNTFEQLSSIYDGIQEKTRVGVCLDTCHAWASGYNFSCSTTYEHMWEKFDWYIGIENLKTIHINDSKNPCNSHLDRHETIGSGTIGLEAFKLLMNDIRFNNIAKIVETPKTTLEDDKYNLAILRSLTVDQNKK